jgi:hypothetical protein
MKTLTRIRTAISYSSGAQLATFMCVYHMHIIIYYIEKKTKNNNDNDKEKKIKKEKPRS